VVETRVPGENLRPDAGHKYFNNIQVILWQLALWSYISGGHQSTSRKPTSSHRSHTLNNIQAILWQPALWSYIGGGNRCTSRKPTSSHRSQTLWTIFKLYCDNQHYDPILVVETGVPGENHWPAAGYKHFQQHYNILWQAAL